MLALAKVMIIMLTKAGNSGTIGLGDGDGGGL